jgi:AAA family ATP:ADP antiporter
MRNALVVADKGGSASFIPYFELFGTFPAAILLTWGLSRLMRVFSFRKVFSITMSLFLGFFLLFPFFIHPNRDTVQLFFEKTFGQLLLFIRWSDLLYYVMAELWKVALLSILFWGFINQRLSYENAKRFYPPLMLGSSIGAILAGPITVFCTSEIFWQMFSFAKERWLHSLISLTIVLVVFGILTLLAFNALYALLSNGEVYPINEEKIPFKRCLLSLSSSLRYMARSPYLLSILFIVVAEYVSYTLGELIFLETLKQKFPSPTDYCKYLGNLTMWTGILTAFSAVFLTPYLIRKYLWSYSVMLTPFLMVIMTCSFFAAVHFGKTKLFAGANPLSFTIFLGSLHFCIGRSTKYTIFDTTKELAFIPLSKEGQVKGKLVIDGIGSRFGRGTSSLISITLFHFVAGPSESVLFAGIVAITFSLFMLPAARLVSRKFETLNMN